MVLQTQFVFELSVERNRNKKEYQGSMGKCPVFKEMINVGKYQGNEIYETGEKERQHTILLHI